VKIVNVRSCKFICSLKSSFCASIADAIRCKSSVIVCKKLENKLYWNYIIDIMTLFF